MGADSFTEEQLMSFADGEAAAGDAAAISAAAATDAALRRKIDFYRQSREVAQQAMPLAPVPADLEARIRAMADQSRALGEKSQPKAAIQTLPRPANDNAGGWWRMPLAASVLFAFGLGGGFLLGRDSAVNGGAVNVAGLLDQELRQSLETVPSGGESQIAGGKFRAIASFRSKDGSFCREFEKDSGSNLAVVGVACNKDGAWSVNTIVASTQTDEGYAPASSLEAIDAYMAAIGAGETLPLAEEKASLDALKKP
jgi:hypothetical protein